MGMSTRPKWVPTARIVTHHRAGQCLMSKKSICSPVSRLWDVMPCSTARVVIKDCLEEIFPLILPDVKAAISKTILKLLRPTMLPVVFRLNARIAIKPIHGNRLIWLTTMLSFRFFRATIAANGMTAIPAILIREASMTSPVFPVTNTIRVEATPITSVSPDIPTTALIAIFAIQPVKRVHSSLTTLSFSLFSAENITGNGMNVKPVILRQ